MHINNIPSDIKLGDKIEAGKLLGYTSLFKENFGKSYEFWELEVNKIINGTAARTDFPFTYFDKESQAVFEKLRLEKSLTSWFVDEKSKDAGWLAYTGNTEAWADISKLGIKAPGDDYCQFLRNNKLI